ncbi:MAG: ABC transporter permease [Alphaproteobacteria bacterium]|nr:ABC transporter permease [Alphaproteobacteria bacterium]
MNMLWKYALPALLGIAVVAAWQGAVRALAVPVYLVPAPSDVWAAFLGDAPSLLASLWATLEVTLIAFACALVGGVALAVLFSQSRTVEAMLYPYAIVLQVTPVVAVAPLLLIWVGYDHVERALVLIAFLVAFFPILSNTTLGLKSTDHNLVDLLRLYGAGRWQILWRLKGPTALPYLLGGAKIAGGLALIGAVVAEMVAGSGTATGLGWRIVEAGNRLEIAKMFAELTLLALLGIAIFATLSAVEHAALRHWHESVLKKDG